LNVADPRDPRGLRDDAPLLDGWLTFTDRAAAGSVRSFTIPGHKQRTDLVGDVVRGDAPLYAGIGSMKDAGGLLADAQDRAARLWGADWCRFSVAGSTHGNQALALAVGGDGGTVVVSRTLHRSMLIGLVLAGLTPVWVRPGVDAATGLPAAVPVDAVRAALAAHPDARAVLLGDPSYVGTVGDVAGHAAAAHAAGVPLLVDAAWAPHFGFHPALPPHPLAAGADAFVTSAHKALPAWTQSALVLARTDRSGGLLDEARLDRAFDATHTTSPSGALMASTDAARALLARDGAELTGRLVAAVAGARRRLQAVRGLAVLDEAMSDGTRVDPTKLVLLLSGTGAHGHAVERDLVAAGMPVEMADRDVVVAMVSLADDAATIGDLVAAVSTSVERHRGPGRPPAPSSAWSVEPITIVPPREAFFARHVTVPVERAVGLVSAEVVAPYPPGIPVLAPGELVTGEAVEALRGALADGTRIAYAADRGLGTLQVLA
jgi:lysine decarboxylase